MYSDGRSQAVANRPKAVIWYLQKLVIHFAEWFLQFLMFTLLLHLVHFAVCQHDCLVRSHAVRHHRHYTDACADVVDIANILP